jgi:hypothetical protein
MQYATIALSCFLLILLLLYYVVSYVRHNLIEYTNEHLAIEMNNRLLHVATGKQRRSAAELAQGFVNEIYECMGENLRLEGVYMLLGDGNGVEPVFAECSGGAVQQRADLYMLSAYDSGKDYVSANETERVLPLRTLTAAGHRTVGVLKIVTARPLSENEVLTLELVSGYLAAAAYHSAVLVESGYQAIDELEEEAERMKFEENRMHVQNINISAMIFTKKEGIAQAVMSEMGRGVTTWEGLGAYTNETSHILYIMISKFEVEQLKDIIHRVDPKAFIIITTSSEIIGRGFRGV